MQIDESYQTHLQSEYEKHLPYDVEGWYDILKEYTSDSLFIPVNKEQAAACIHYYQARFNNKDVFTKEDYLALQCLEFNVSTIFRGTGDNKTGTHFPSAFVRLSSRSPKDGMPLDSPEVKKIYSDALQSLHNEFPPTTKEEEANLGMIAAAESQATFLRVCNEREVMNLLLTSERVFVDLLRMEGIAKQCNLIARRWNDDIKDSLEFRLFVKDENVICISQYNHYCMFPRVLAKYGPNQKLGHEKLKTELLSTWKKVHALLLSHPSQHFQGAYKDSYVLDIGIIEKEEGSLDSVVIELNPYQRTTGGALFTWNEIDRVATEKEAVLLESTPDNVELRFLLQPREGIQNLLEDMILPSLDDTFPAYDTFYGDHGIAPQRSKLNSIFSSFFGTRK